MPSLATVSRSTDVERGTGDGPTTADPSHRNDPIRPSSVLSAISTAGRIAGNSWEQQAG
jgi:hypothetical protein